MSVYEPGLARVEESYIEALVVLPCMLLLPVDNFSL